MSLNRFSILAGASMLTATSVIALAQDKGAPAATPADRTAPAENMAADYPAPKLYPQELRERVAEHLSRARKLAGADLFQDMAYRCIVSPVFPDRVARMEYNAKITPTKLFDNFYSIGQNAVSAHALTTSAGIIIFDTLSSEDEAKNLLVPNMAKLGLNPGDIKYIVISHEHLDHIGGARYLQKTYGAKVIASTVAWGVVADFVHAKPGNDLLVPDKEIEMGDGQSLTLGNTRVTFYLTPGHTKGTLSSIFSVTDGGTPHVVGYFGGTGAAPTNPEWERDQIASLEKWAPIALKAGVDVNITNHPLHSEALEKEELLRYRLPGDANPLVLGKAVYQRYVKIQEECAKVQLARLGFDK
ncbi:MAG TPA: MBL fold metallo-hydrolase [Rhizomicrobium sp.]|jgi:metallo-beta-lactamase class B|nr:MBL fold metallo-hydrolase [Rhizomicrobium sp.]